LLVWLGNWMGIGCEYLYKTIETSTACFVSFDGTTEAGMECEVGPSPDEHLMISHRCRVWTKGVSQTSSHLLHELRSGSIRSCDFIVAHTIMHLVVCPWMSLLSGQLWFSPDYRRAQTKQLACVTRKYLQSSTRQSMRSMK
jgi:hypothetical protein